MKAKEDEGSDLGTFTPSILPCWRNKVGVCGGIKIPYVPES